MAKRRSLALGIITLLGALVVLALLLTLYLWPVVVPSVTRMTVPEATELLEQSGLKLGGSSQAATDSVGAGRILEQDPAASASVRKGSEVDIVVAVAPVPADVPDVVGLEAGFAEEALMDALYVVRSLVVFSDDVGDGDVVAQIPEAGTEWLTGRPVGIAVSAGPDDGTGIRVPDLMGSAPDVALLTLEEAGLIGSSFVSTMPGTPPGGPSVIMQLPQAGVLVPPGTTVLLLFNLP